MQFHHVIGDTGKIFKVKRSKITVTGSKVRSQRKVMYQQQKRYNTAMDIDFKLGMAS